MCGVAGFAGMNISSQDELGALLWHLTDLLAHRGPDDRGVVISPSAWGGLASTRLAIQDLTQSGHMPMGSDEGSLHVALNGEIYNAPELRTDLRTRGHTFRSSSDTEVLLRGYEAWGTDVFRRLSGMFAVAILDGRRGGRRLVLARDPVGIKPFYYRVTPSHELYFSSELRALLRAGLAQPIPNATALTGFLTFGSVPEPWTIIDGVSTLEPGTFLVWEPEVLSIHHYMTLEPRVRDRGIAPSDFADEVHATLLRVFRRHQISDAPLGAFLSGGVDSAAVVAYLALTSSGQVQTRTLDFDDAAYSEGSAARRTARSFGTQHIQQVIASSDVIASLPSVLRHMDQPTIDGFNSYLISRAARHTGLTVAVSGVGADELFGGYKATFGVLPHLHRATRRLPRMPAAIHQCLSRPIRRFNRMARLSDALSHGSSLPALYVAARALLPAESVRRLVDPSFGLASHFQPEDYASSNLALLSSDRRLTLTTSSQISVLELRLYLRNQLLRDLDTMSMAHGLEVRVPFLDLELVHLLLSRAPTDGAVRPPKPILRRSLGKAAPGFSLPTSSKRGFTLPFDTWLRTDLRDLRRDALRSGSLGTLGIAPAAALDHEAAFEQQRRHWSTIWMLVILAAWWDDVTSYRPTFRI